MRYINMLYILIFILVIVLLVLAWIHGYVFAYRAINNGIKNKFANNQRYNNLQVLRNKWGYYEKSEKNIGTFLVDNKLFNIAIYGYGEFGRKLHKEVSSYPQINIKYLIDRRADEIDTSIPIYRLGDTIPEADILIVTTDNYNEIRNVLGMNRNIVLLKDILDFLNSN